MFILVTNKFKYNLHNHIYVCLLVCAIFVTLDHYCYFQTFANFVTFMHAGCFLSFTNQVQQSKRGNDRPCMCGIPTYLVLCNS